MGLAEGDIVSAAPIVRRADDQGAYLFGYLVDGVPVWFASRKLGGVDDDLQRAKEAAAAVVNSQPSEPAAPAPGPDVTTPLPGDPGPSEPTP